MLISGTNDFVNNTADMCLLSEGLYEEVGVNWLKDLLIENGESIGKDFFRKRSSRCPYRKIGIYGCGFGNIP